MWRPPLDGPYALERAAGVAADHSTRPDGRCGWIETRTSESVRTGATSWASPDWRSGDAPLGAAGPPPGSVRSGSELLRPPTINHLYGSTQTAGCRTDCGDPRPTDARAVAVLREARQRLLGNPSGDHPGRMASVLTKRRSSLTRSFATRCPTSASDSTRSRTVRTATSRMRGELHAAGDNARRERASVAPRERPPSAVPPARATSAPMSEFRARVGGT
jgi:hypothetical protein